MKRYLALFAAMFLAWGLFAQNQAVIKEFSGKVEVQLPGKGWAPAARNAVIPLGASVSTGFNSYATLDLGVSVVRVKPLTRMSVAELSRKGSMDVTAVDLRVGRVNAKINKAEGLEHNFTLRTPVSTAAVRGSEIEGHAIGKTRTIAGVTRVSNLLGQTRTLSPGESSSGTGKSEPKKGEDNVAKETITTITTTPVVVAVPPPPPPKPVVGGSIRVIIGEEYAY